jgi:DNA-binding MarR family transcriptional regulator
MTISTGGGFGYALTHAAQTWRVEAAEVLRPHELTVPQFLVLMALFRQSRHGWAPLTQAEISKRLDMDANTTSQIVRGLEKRALLTRDPHPGDARARALALTDAGRQLAVAASADARDHNDRYFAVLTPEQLDALDHILKTLTTESEKRS